MSENVSFHPAIFRIFLTHLRATFQSAGDAMVFSMAKDFSGQAMLMVGKQLGVGIDMDPNRIIDVFAERMDASGWGNFVMRKMDFEAFDFEVELSASPFPEIVEEPGSIMCYFYRGVLCGFFEFLTRRPMMIKGPETLSIDGGAVFHIAESH
jgi:predicted hydrocarbon binding protein